MGSFTPIPLLYQPQQINKQPKQRGLGLPIILSKKKELDDGEWQWNHSKKVYGIDTWKHHIIK